MSKKLFVGRLPFDFTDEKLEALIAGAGGVVSARMIPDPKQGRTRGFGFVDMKTEAEAQAAIEKFNGHTLGDRQIWVTLARPKIAASPGARRSETPRNEKPALHTPRGPRSQPRGDRAWKGRQGNPKPGAFEYPRFRARKPGGGPHLGRGSRPIRGPRPQRRPPDSQTRH